YSKFKAPPTTWKQKFWEQPSAFFTFWGAAVTITIATLVFGSISAITAFLTLDLAQKTLNLAMDAAASASKTALDCAPNTCGAPARTPAARLYQGQFHG